MSERTRGETNDMYEQSQNETATCKGGRPCSRCKGRKLVCVYEEPLSVSRAPPASTPHTNTTAECDESATEALEQYHAETKDPQGPSTMLDSLRETLQFQRRQLKAPLLDEIKRQIEENERALSDLSTASGSHLESLCQEAGTNDELDYLFDATKDDILRLLLVAHQVDENESSLEALKNDTGLRLGELYAQAGYSSEVISRRFEIVNYEALRMPPLYAPEHVGMTPIHQASATLQRWHERLFQIPDRHDDAHLVQTMDTSYASNKDAHTDLSSMALSSLLNEDQPILAPPTVPQRQASPSRQESTTTDESVEVPTSADLSPKGSARFASRGKRMRSSASRPVLHIIGADLRYETLGMMADTESPQKRFKQSQDSNEISKHLVERESDKEKYPG